MSWIDHYERFQKFPSLLYACIEARFAIEYLIFEEIIIGTGCRLTQEEYRKCLKEGQLEKSLKKIVPDYEKLSEFTLLVAEQEPALPKIITVEPKKLMKSWGKLSQYLHWFGSKDQKAENPEWLIAASGNIRSIVVPLWELLTSGRRGIMHPNDMHPKVREIWLAFKEERINRESAKFQIHYMEATVRGSST